MARHTSVPAPPANRVAEATRGQQHRADNGEDQADDEQHVKLWHQKCQDDEYDSEK